MAQDFFLFALAGFLISGIIMAALWSLSRLIGKVSIVDPGWSGIISFLGLMYATLAGGYDLRRFLAGVMVTAWGGRLTFFILFRRVLGKGEDPRYVEWIKDWGNRKDEKLFRFFMLQAAAAAVFSLPFLLVCLNPAPGISFIEWTGFLLWIAAFLGETAADWQLEIFKSNPENRGKTCRAGLWNYSRHPNYFFEFLHWCAVALFALGSPAGIFTTLCPAAIFYFLFNVTGIPKNEEQAVRSRGEDYRDYQRTTSMFVPWFHKKKGI